MRIGINLLYRAPGAGGGVETYVHGLVNEMIRLDTKNEYVIFSSRTTQMFPTQCAANVNIVTCAVDSNKRGRRYLWEQAILPLQVRSREIRLLHSMNYVGPIVCPCKSLVTIQDVSYRERAVVMSLTRR